MYDEDNGDTWDSFLTAHSDKSLNEEMMHEYTSTQILDEDYCNIKSIAIDGIENPQENCKNGPSQLPYKSNKLKAINDRRASELQKQNKLSSMSDQIEVLIENNEITANEESINEDKVYEVHSKPSSKKNTGIVQTTSGISQKCLLNECTLDFKEEEKSIIDNNANITLSQLTITLDGTNVENIFKEGINETKNTKENILHSQHNGIVEYINKFQDMIGKLDTTPIIPSFDKRNHSTIASK